MRRSVLRITHPDLPLPSSGVSLVQRFTLASLITTTVVGLLFGAIAARVAEGYALRRQAQMAAVYVTEFVAPRLMPGDFLAPPPAKRVQFEFALRDLVGKAGIVRVAVWNKYGQVLYSDDHGLVGLTFPLAPPLRLALTGHIQSQLTRSMAGAGAGKQHMEVFVPVILPGVARPVGVYDIVSDISDLEPVLTRLKWSVWATVVLGVSVLYLALFTIVRRASRDLDRQHTALRRAFEGTVRSLANAVDTRDMATANHSSRVADYAVAIAREMGLSTAEMHEVHVAGFLHDLGKIGIPDGILAKRGPLSKEEWTMMRRHPLFGYEILQPVPIAETIKLAIRHSHESWDGSGYPEGLRGEQIPLAARVVAVADAYEALTTNRPYRTAQGPEDAMNEIRRCAGGQFDPAVVEAFLRVWPQMSGAATLTPPALLPQRAGIGR
jgi:HD-GYP domain-containing protein (c-di-GMP phosphodiesterase class II)